MWPAKGGVPHGWFLTALASPRQVPIVGAKYTTIRAKSVTSGRSPRRDARVGDAALMRSSEDTLCPNATVGSGWALW